MISRTDTGKLDFGGVVNQQVEKNREFLVVQDSSRTETSKGTVRVTETIGKPATIVLEVEKDSFGVNRNLRGGGTEAVNGIEVEYGQGNTNPFLNSGLDRVVVNECKDEHPVGPKTGKWKRWARNEARFDSKLVVDSQLGKLTNVSDEIHAEKKLKMVSNRLVSMIDIDETLVG
ncbi:hypothetical protein QYF36_007028 [Acer negundo]|nr:hypothetical protein QYF36_007028 [Acer negundo]